MHAPHWLDRPPVVHKPANSFGIRRATVRASSILGWAVAITAVCSAAPACGQVAVEVALQSDYRVRGFSISDERPVAAITVSYDDPSGIYAGGTAAGAIREGEPGIVSLQGNVGYARRVSADISLDVGLSRFEYLSSYGSARDYHYTEAYAGVATRKVAARIRYSPDYIWPATETIYVELDGGTEIAQNWLVSAHVGALQYLDDPPGYLPRRRYDWRIGLTRRIGSFGVHLDLVGRIARTTPLPPGASRPGGSRTALVASLTRAF